MGLHLLITQVCIYYQAEVLDLIRSVAFRRCCVEQKYTAEVFVVYLHLSALTPSSSSTFVAKKRPPFPTLPLPSTLRTSHIYLTFSACNFQYIERKTIHAPVRETNINKRPKCSECRLCDAIPSESHEIRTAKSLKKSTSPFLQSFLLLSDPHRLGAQRALSGSSPRSGWLVT